MFTMTEQMLAVGMFAVTYGVVFVGLIWLGIKEFLDK